LIEENESADGKINETQEPPDEQMSDIDNSEENGSQINASNLSTADSETQTITDADTILGTQTESLTSPVVKKEYFKFVDTQKLALKGDYSQELIDNFDKIGFRFTDKLEKEAEKERQSITENSTSIGSHKRTIQNQSSVLNKQPKK